MNLRKTFLALGAMILGVGFLGAFPQQANAQAITCTAVPKSITDWPYAGSTNPARYCGTATSANGVTVGDSLHQLPKGYLESSYTLLKNVAPFYVFKNKAEFQTYWNQQNSNPPPGVTVPNPADTAPGFTFYTGALAPVYTVVFVQAKTSSGATVNTNMRNTTVHEAGHWLDYFHRTKFSGAVSKVTEGTAWANNLAVDWNNFNGKPNCGTNGVFRGKKNHMGAFICSGLNGVGGSPIYSGNNQAVLNAAWPGFFNLPKEIFAEEFAADNNAADGGGQMGITQYLSGFTCTKTIVHSLGDYGTKPGVAPTHDAAGNPITNGPVVTWIPSTPGGQQACVVNIN